MIGYDLNQRRETAKKVFIFLLLIGISIIIAGLLLYFIAPVNNKKDYCESVGVVAENITVLKRKEVPLYLIIRKLGPDVKSSLLMTEIYYYDDGKDQTPDPFMVKKVFMDSCEKYYDSLQ